MSVTGIASSILTAVGGSQNYQTRSQQIQSEFQQLGQALQSGNLSQAQSDFTTLSQNLPGLSQSSTAAATTAATTASTTAGSSASNIAQTFAQLGQDLQSGNLTAAQQAYTTLQQDTQQTATQQAGGHRHHHHHAASSQNSSSTSTSSSSQQTNPITTAFGQLAQSLQSGNLQGAQSAFATLQNDLQQIGGFVSSASNAAASTAAGSLNVTA